MYSKKVTSAEPALLILLIDQSSSMGHTLVETDQGESYSSAKMAKYVTDRFLYEAMQECVSGTEFKPYLDLAVIGYSSDQPEYDTPGKKIRSALPKIPLEKFPFSVTELPNTFIAKNVIDPNDNSMFPKPKREWVEARADAYTSTLAAFTKAREIIEKWLPDHQTSFPPVVINITDGMPTDDEPLARIWQKYMDDLSVAQSKEDFEASRLGDVSQSNVLIESQKIRKIGTDDGNCLVCNCHITIEKIVRIRFPSSSDRAESVNPFAKIMYHMSSIIPESLREMGISELNLPLEPNSRFFLFNAEVDDMIKFMKFGSSGSLGKIKEPTDKICKNCGKKMSKHSSKEMADCETRKDKGEDDESS